MFVKSDIRKIIIAVEKTLCHEVYLALGQAGLIHLARFQEKDAVTDTGLQEEETLAREIASAVSYSLNALQIEREAKSANARLVDARKDKTFADETKNTLERVARLQNKIQDAREILEREIQHAKALNRMGISPEMIKNTGIVQTVFGAVEDMTDVMPVDERFVISRTGNYVCCLTLPRYWDDMLNFLKEIGFNNRSAEVSPVPLADLKKRADSLQRRAAAIENHILRLREEKGASLQQIYSDYKAYEEMLKAMRLSVFSSRAMFITGWMEASQKTRLIEIMQKICGNKFVLSERKDPHAPVRLLNRRLLRPFELLVKTMGIPSNSEIDPTPLTAITFVLMFGLMFGDLGQGLVLLLGGLMLRKIGQKRSKEELAQAGGILVACGGSAALCGLLYGSVFSSEHIIPALWFHPTEQIMQLFFITIMMGAAFIFISFIINIINNLMNSDLTAALLEKRGLAIAVLYVTLVYSAVQYLKTGHFPASWATGFFIITPVIVFSLRGVLGSLFFSSPKPGSISEYLIETIMDIVEIALSLFANTISFIRVGAFALSHAGLSIVTYTLAGMADPALKSTGAIIIIIIGNIFIIGFEGLICGIQSLRLEYYEFFSRFFKGDGIVFSPFTLKAKTAEV